MIAYLKGTLFEITPEYVIIEVNSIGYQVCVPSYLFEDTETYYRGATVTLYTSMQVREDDVSLFGFGSLDEKELFLRLICVNGIGPKGAIAVLSTFAPDQLRYLILMEDAKQIAKTPGIGLKTAQKLILELKDKIQKDELLPDTGNLDVTRNKASSSKQGNAMQETIEALESLGFGHAEAQKAVKAAMALSNDASSEELLKLALKQM